MVKIKYLLIVILVIFLALISGCAGDFEEDTGVPESFSVKYQPMQCEEEPWDVWLENSEIRFIQAPTDKEVIIMYYAELGVELNNVEEIQMDIATCSACYTCPEDYYFTASVSSDKLEIMLDDGWVLEE